MIDIRLGDGEVLITLSGWDRFFTLRRAVRVPLSAIIDVRPAPEMIDSRPVGVRLPGTFLPIRPGPLLAGTFRARGGRRTFWALRRATAEQILRIDVADDPLAGSYRMLVVQVDDPGAEATRIRQAIGRMAK